MKPVRSDLTPKTPTYTAGKMESDDDMGLGDLMPVS